MSHAPLPSFLEMLQNPHVLLTFDKVHNPLCVPRETVRTPGAFNILTSKCASRHNGVHFFDISTSKSGPDLVCFVHFDFEMCFAPQRRALFRHRNFQQWSEHMVFLTFWLRNVLRATTACTCSTSQLPKVVRTYRAFNILTSECASRYNGVHFFDISTSKCAPNVKCFELFHLQMCFAPQRRAAFRRSTRAWKTSLQRPPLPTAAFATFLACLFPKCPLGCLKLSLFYGSESDVRPLRSVAWDIHQGFKNFPAASFATTWPLSEGQLWPVTFTRASKTSLSCFCHVPGLPVAYVLAGLETFLFLLFRKWG